MIYFGCPNCGAAMSSPDSMGGQKEKCPECGNIALVPQKEPPPSTTPASVAVKPMGDLENLAASTQAPARRSPSRRSPVQQNHVKHSHHGRVKIETKGTNGMGVASLVMGIVAAFGCWIPFLNMISIILAIIGIIFGVLGFTISLAGRKSGVGLPVSGCLVCIISIIIASGINTVAVQAIDEAIKEKSEVSRDVKWVSSSMAISSGDMVIGVNEIFVGQVSLRDIMGEEYKPNTEYLLLKIHLKNSSETQITRYSSWNGADFTISRDFATLKDNFGNAYQRVGFGMRDVVGQNKHLTIRPGEQGSDLFVFQVPIEKAIELFLELPAKNFGGKGMLRFKISANEWK
jgi:hypothetical protein